MLHFLEKWPGISRPGNEHIHKLQNWGSYKNCAPGSTGPNILYKRIKRRIYGIKEETGRTNTYSIIITRCNGTRRTWENKLLQSSIHHPHHIAERTKKKKSKKDQQKEEKTDTKAVKEGRGGGGLVGVEKVNLSKAKKHGHHTKKNYW